MWEQLLNKLAKGMITKGNLVIVHHSGKSDRFGDGTGPEITLRIKDAALPRKLVLNPELAIGEAYMDERATIDGDDLPGLMALLLKNLGQNGYVWWHKPVEVTRHLLRWTAQFNPAGRAKSNVAHHYDLSAELYDLFLDDDKQYSCAYFRDPSDTLEQAQINKKAHIANKLLIEPGMRILDIGCGWGGLGLTLARDYGAEVVGVTLSEEQHKIATERARAAGLEDQVDFRLTDYRNVTGQFDRIVSVGMFEHVGVPHYREYFRHVREKLTEDGVALIHTIGRNSPPGTTSPWITKYIFPGGYVPAMSEAVAAYEKEGLYCDDIEVWRMHYAETLRIWRERFVANEDKARALYDDRFCRMWRYYLLACEMTFRHNGQVVFQFQLSRKQEAVPLTRDYLYPASREGLRHAAE